jgi:hypothetical protein
LDFANGQPLFGLLVVRQRFHPRTAEFCH